MCMAFGIVIEIKENLVDNSVFPFPLPAQNFGHLEFRIFADLDEP